MFCQRCGAQVSGFAGYCSRCGTPVLGGVQMKAPPARARSGIPPIVVVILVVCAGCFALTVAVLLSSGRRSSPQVSADTPSTRQTPPSPSRAAHIGDTVTVGGARPFICGSSKDAYDEAMKWAVLNDQLEMARSLAKTRSTLLMPGTRVKILDSSFLLRKVRVLDSDKLSALLPPDKECWVALEAVNR